MSSRAELDKIFPSLVKRYTDRRGYTDWLSLIEHLQIGEITTLRNRQWQWRNAESWWLRNRRRIMENRARTKIGSKSDTEHNETAQSGETQETVTPAQLNLDFS